MAHNVFPQNVQSVLVRYDRLRAADLSGYDMAVIDPQGLEPSELRRVREAGTVVFAYVSVLEIRTDDPLFSLLQEEDWLKVNGVKVCNEHYGNFLADLRSPRWKALLLHRMGQLLMLSGFDGLFLDTVGDVEWPFLPSEVADPLQSAIVELIREVKSLFPDRYLIQNNGLERLSEQTAPWIDVFCWENPRFMEPHLTWCRSVMWRMDELIRRYPHIHMLLLWSEETETDRLCRAAMQQMGSRKWLWSRSGKEYLG